VLRDILAEKGNGRVRNHPRPGTDTSALAAPYILASGLEVLPREKSRVRALARARTRRIIRRG